MSVIHELHDDGSMPKHDILSEAIFCINRASTHPVRGGNCQNV